MVGVLELSRAECIGELLWNAGGNGWGICSVGNMLAAMCGPVQLIASPILIGTDDADTRGDEFTDDELRLLVHLSRDRAEKHKEICGDVRLSDNLITVRKRGDEWFWSRRSWTCGSERCQTLAELIQQVMDN